MPYTSPQSWGRCQPWGESVKGNPPGPTQPQVSTHGASQLSAPSPPLGLESLDGEQPAQLYEAAMRSYVVESGRECGKNSFLGPSPKVSNQSV